MAKATAVINFADPGASASFALVQEDWPKKNPARFVDWLADNGSTVSGGGLFWAFEQYKSSCNGDGDLVAQLRVRLRDLATPYTLRASYGQVGPATLITETRREFLGFELESKKEIDFGAITGAAWNGSVYDTDGNIITPPAVVISGIRASVPLPVYGVLEVTVTETCYRHSLTISPRTPTPEQAASDELIYDELYASTAMLFCLERITIEDIDMPDNFGNCSGGFGNRIVDPEPEPEVRTYQVAFDIFDYCSGNVIPDASIYVDGIPLTGTSMLLESGEHTIQVTAPGYTPSDDDELTENDTFTLE